MSQQSLFIKNEGQIINQKGEYNKKVKYLLNLKDYNVSFYEDHFSYEIISTNILDTTKANINRIEVWFETPSENKTIESKNISTEKLNIYRGGKEHLNIKQYKSIVYKNAWEGIDIEFLVENNRLKYNYIVRNKIKEKIGVQIKGASVKINKNSIILKASNKKIKEEIPKSYYTLPSGKEQIIDINITKHNQTITYNLPSNRKHTLTIDPVVYTNQYTTYYGGAHMDFAHSISQTKTNNIIISGYTLSTNNIATTGAFQTTISDQDAFVAAFNAGGTRLWATYFGGNGYERVYTATLDSNDNIFIAGNTTSAIGISTNGANQQFIASADDAFVAKFSSTGSLIWSTYYGGDNHELITHITIDDSNKILVTGHTSSTNLQCTPNAYRNNLVGYENAFLGVFDNLGNLDYSSYYVKGSNTRGEAITVTKNGVIYLAGYTNDVSSIPNTNVHQNQNGGYVDGFIFKISNQYQTIWKTYFGGEHNDLIKSVAIDSTENIYITGETKSTTNISTPLSYNPNHTNNWDGFVAKIDSSCNLIWGTYINGGDDERMKTIVIKDTTIWVLGITNGNAILASLSAVQNTNKGGYDNIILKFSKDGDNLWNSYFGGSNNDFGNDIKITDNRKILITGNTGTNNNFTTANAHQPNYGGNAYDGFWTILCKPIHPTYLSENQTINICEGDSVPIYSTNNFNYYNWSNGSTLNSIYVSTAGNYYLETKDINNCPGKSDTLIVNVIPKLDINIQSSANAICFEDSSNLYVNSAYETYAWNNGDTSSNIYITDNQQYYLSTTDSFGCVYNSDTISLPISQHLFPIQIIGDTLICSGGEAILYTDNSNSILWNTNSTSSSIQANTSGNYWFTGVDNYNCEIISDTITINQINYDTPSSVLDTLLNFYICINDSVKLIAEDNFSQYIWSNGDTTSQTIITEEGYYYISATDSNGCVGISDSVEVIFKSDGKSLLHYPNGLSFCEGDNVIVHTDTGLTDINWNSTNLQQDSIIVSTPGNYYYNAIDNLGCETYSDTINIVEYPLPQVAITPVLEDSICLYDSIFVSSVNSLNQYLWSNGDTYSGTFYNLNTVGNNTIYLIGKDYNNCENKDSLTINVVDCEAYIDIKERNKNIIIYNTKNNIIIKSDKILQNIKLIDINGKTIAEENNIYKNNAIINTTKYPKSVYIIIIKLKNIDRYYSKKILVN